MSLYLHDSFPYRNNHDNCVECGQLVGTNPNCENCRRIAQSSVTPPEYREAFEEYEREYE